MKIKASLTLLFLATALSAGLLSGCCEKADVSDVDLDKIQAEADSLKLPGEGHLKNIRQLTFGGNNAEAYFSFDGKELVFQSDFADWTAGCDQIFRMSATEGAAAGKPQRISNGEGRTTCAYFMPGDSLLLFASTHLGGTECPPEPDRAVVQKYVWPIYDSYDIFVADRQGNGLRQLTAHKGYDAEATVSPKGDRIVFTSTRSGDLELWTMNIDGTDLKQVTDLPGYDGGAFFSPDGSKLVFRASRPEKGPELKEYQKLLKEGLVEPGDLEIYVCNADGSDLKQITELGGANWAPYFHPSGEKIIFASNHHGGGRQFNLFMVNLDGSGLEQITFDPTFDAFPMFSPDGKYLVWSSNRHNGGGRDTNVFIAEWVD